MNIKHTVKERFLRYVQIDTQSDPQSKSHPSTEKQKDLSRLLVKELLEMGIEDAEMDEWGLVYATIPSNIKQDVPVICFCAHVDTSPDCSGTDVKPIVHHQYDGSDLVLPDDPDVVLRPTEHPDLLNQIGNDVITASGTTLLGADDKAGVAVIMDLAQHLMKHPESPHGKIRLLFTPDEEIGRGVDKVDMKKLAADFGYTIDGETLGSIEDETFSADGLKLTIHGVSAHTGFAKDKMQHALKIAADVISQLPKDRLSPESTEDKEGFVHPVNLSGHTEKATINFLIRDFEDHMLTEHEAEIETIVQKVIQDYPGARYKIEIQEQYRNMKNVLDQHPEVMGNALEALKRAGIKAIRRSIRGGTDGSRLSFMGLPCPNIFSGEHAFHSKVEWVSVQDMEKSVETLVHLSQIWAGH